MHRLRVRQGQGADGLRAPLDDHHRRGEEGHGDPRGRPRAARRRCCRTPIRSTRSRSSRAAWRSASTMQLPVDDKHNYSRDYLNDQIAILLGGRIAEEITSGSITTGAGNDLERSTELARKMVCEWGMSDAMGPLTFGKKEEQIFLGREIAQHQDYSEDTAIRIDHEIKRFVTDQLRARQGRARGAPRVARADRRGAPRPRSARRRAGAAASSPARRSRRTSRRRSRPRVEDSRARGQGAARHRPADSAAAQADYPGITRIQYQASGLETGVRGLID